MRLKKLHNNSYRTQGGGYVVAVTSKVVTAGLPVAVLN
jgi:hypothetical protein